MQGGPELSPIINYGLLPVYLAATVGLLLAAWYGFVFWLTLKKPQKSLATLAAAGAPVIDIAALKNRYLEQIAQVESAYQTRQIKPRMAHQKLSTILRQFAGEAGQSGVQSYTLAELKQTRFTQLVPAIESYYPPEFAALENGSVERAVTLARKVVAEWH